MNAKTNRNARRYYAEYCPYGLNSLSSDDRLMVFETAEERDEMVERLNSIHYERIEGVAHCVTRKEAAKRYRVQDLCTWYEREVYGLRTCANRCFFEIGSKAGGPLI